MFSLSLAFIEPLISLCLFVFGASFFTVLIAVTLKANQSDGVVIGVVQSAYFAGLLLGGVFVNRFIRRSGHIRSYAAFASILSVSMLTMGLWTEPYSWMVLRLLFGFSIAAMYVVIESWLLSYANTQNRGAILSFYMVALYLAQSGSQLFYKEMSGLNLNPYMLGAIFVCLSAIPLALAFTKPPEVEDVALISIKRLVTAAPLGVAGCLIGGVIQGSIYASLPSFCLDYQYEPSQMLAIAIIGGGCLQWPIGKLSDIFDRRTVLIAVSIAMLVPCFLMFFLSDYEPAVKVLCFLIGGLSFALYPLGISQACDRLKPEEITGATALLLVSYGVGSVVSPIAAACFMAISPLLLFAFYLLFAGLLVLIGFYSVKVKAPVPMEDQVKFMPIPSTTVVAAELDPRMSHVTVDRSSGSADPGK
jgi:MFS family permease